jgi:hypothetical protein
MAQDFQDLTGQVIKKIVIPAQAGIQGFAFAGFGCCKHDFSDAISASLRAANKTQRSDPG